MMAYRIINGSVGHGGKIYQEGATLPLLGAEEAAILLELGVIAETTPPTKLNKKDD